MSVIVELTILGEAFLLGSALDLPPDTHVELERVVPVSRDVLPFFWLTADDGDPIESLECTVNETEHVDGIVELDRLHDRVLYKVEWNADVESLIHGFDETNATILEAHGRDEWYFRLRFPDHESLSTFDGYCTKHGIDYELERVSTETDSPDGVYEFALSNEQRETLLLAIERGYFDVPRGVTLDELATELDVSQQSVSERIRRGMGNVLDAVMNGASN